MSRKNIRLKWFGRGNIDDIETHVLILFAVINSYPFLSWTSLLSRTSLLCFVVRNHFFLFFRTPLFSLQQQTLFLCCLEILSFAVITSYPCHRYPLLFLQYYSLLSWFSFHWYHELQYEIEIKIAVSCSVDIILKNFNQIRNVFWSN